MTPQQKLVQLYSTSSKHSNYQVLAPDLRSLVDDNDIHTKTRSEKERFEYLLTKIDFANQTVIDIGANTGYFTFEAIKHGAKHVTVYEGNEAHAEFVRVAAEALGVKNSVSVINEYFAFDQSISEEKCDILLLFNVLHHIGDDYGDNTLSIEQAQRQIIEQLNSLTKIAKTVVFQLGFNWQGNPNFPLFKNGTKAEVIDYLKAGTEDHWEITSIGIATKQNDTVIYKECNPINIQRDNSLGEFLNRPIFILKSKV